VTFGFHTAVDIATEVIDRFITTASSHKRSWSSRYGDKSRLLTLYSSIAGGADIVVLPEIPSTYKIANSVHDVRQRQKLLNCSGCEGAMDKEEAKLKKKERAKLREERGETTATARSPTESTNGSGLTPASLCQATLYAEEALPPTTGFWQLSSAFMPQG
jgi:6-phosphofructokinase 1